MYFLVASGFFLMNSVVRVAEPPCQGASGSPRMYFATTPASTTRVVPFMRPTVPVGSSV